jgi:acid phosphatase
MAGVTPFFLYWISIIMNYLLNKTLLIVTISMVFIFSNPLFSEPQNLGLIKNELKNYYDVGDYQKELSQVIQTAQKYIDEQATSNQKQKSPQQLALVLDIDETSLSNYQFMAQRDFGGPHQQYHQEVMEAHAPVIKPMLALYQDALKHGIKIFFITGRHESERSATANNLERAGYKHWAGLYLRPNNYSLKSIIPFKSNARKMITEKGYTIVASIGDQYSDLKGGYAQKVFKLPNPFYYLP